jgi:hypothetical protein
MAQQELKLFKDYRWIVADPELLGGKLAIRELDSRYRLFSLARRKE